MVCILTISVWKPADSPALWARQGCRFIREEGREGVTPDISSHGTSLQYFSLVMWLPGQMSGHLGLCGRPCLLLLLLITQLQRPSGAASQPDVSMWRCGGEGGKHFRECRPRKSGFGGTTSLKLGRGAWLPPINKKYARPRLCCNSLFNFHLNLDVDYVAEEIGLHKLKKKKKKRKREKQRDQKPTTSHIFPLNALVHFTIL